MTDFQTEFTLRFAPMRVRFGVRAVKADAVVSLGGRSTTGLGKAIALQTDLPQIVVPTTCAGSEAMAILGQTDGGHKTTITDPRVQPEGIIHDPALLATLPIALTVTSGRNAIAHGAEALHVRTPSRLAGKQSPGLFSAPPHSLRTDLAMKNAERRGSI